MENILVTIITSAVTLRGTITTIIITHSKNTADIQEMKTDIKELKDFDKRIAILETTVNNLKEVVHEIKGGN